MNHEFTLRRIRDNDCGRPLVRRAWFAGCEACDVGESGFAVHLLVEIFPLHRGDTYEVTSSAHRVVVLSRFKDIVRSLWLGRFQLGVSPYIRRPLNNIATKFTPSRLP